MNLIALIGNVAAEPDLRHTNNGRPVCTFRLAVSRPGGDQADFFTVVAWERQAEICNEYLHTGRRVGVEGRLHHSTWEVEGEKRSKVEIVAHRVQLLGGPRPADPDRKPGERDANEPIAGVAPDDFASTDAAGESSDFEPLREAELAPV